MKKIFASIFLLLNALFFINVTYGQEVLPTININASRPNLNSFSSDFVGDIGPPAKGPTVFGTAFMPVSPRLQCEFTRSLRQDLKNCNFANPPNIGEFRLDMKVGKKEPFTKAVFFTPNPAALQNGCGPANGWLKHVIPNAPLGYDFTNACNNHDVCYGSRWGKNSCDNAFERDMMQSCGGSGTCEAAARGYAEAVRKFGDGPYQDSVDQWFCALFGFMRNKVGQYYGASLCIL
ncbi:phospholipase A2 [Burkholderia contaminans]|uniref:phospholipase A2 n=1 Tax=Burkholderia contaminans TaxID=488447 RepID=UPI001CF10942|nr:phospholipase A2 [Burkholderia contaminans]MCA8101194.1 phospholipase [Burkholderia contaminans]